MSIAGDLIRGHTDAIILARLLRGDSYGYEINKTISTLSSGRFELKEATLYTAFKRLEEQGYIASYWGDSGAGARRRYYTITPAGREACHRLMQEWEETKEENKTKLLNCINELDENYKNAINNLSLAHKIFLAHKDISNVSTCLSLNGLMKYIEKAETYYKSLLLLEDSKFLAESTGEKTVLAVNKFAFGQIYFMENKVNEALFYLTYAANALKDIPVLQAKAYELLALIYIKMQNTKMAYESLEKAYVIAKDNVPEKLFIEIKELSQNFINSNSGIDIGDETRLNAAKLICDLLAKFPQGAYFKDETGVITSCNLGTVVAGGIQNSVASIVEKSVKTNNYIAEIIIEGHTDTDGGYQSNMELADCFGVDKISKAFHGKKFKRNNGA